MICSKQHPSSVEFSGVCVLFLCREDQSRANIAHGFVVICPSTCGSTNNPLDYAVVPHSWITEVEGHQDATQLSSSVQASVESICSEIRRHTDHRGRFIPFKDLARKGLIRWAEQLPIGLAPQQQDKVAKKPKSEGAGVKTNKRKNSVQRRDSAKKKNAVVQEKIDEQKQSYSLLQVLV